MAQRRNGRSSGSEMVDVSLVFAEVPQQHRHRVTIEDADGRLRWRTGGPCPESMSFESDALLTVVASIAAPPETRASGRPSVERKLQATPGARAVLRIGSRQVFERRAGLEIHVIGARLVNPR